MSNKAHKNPNRPRTVWDYPRPPNWKSAENSFVLVLMGGNHLRMYESIGVRIVGETAIPPHYWKTHTQKQLPQGMPTWQSQRLGGFLAASYGLPCCWMPTPTTATRLLAAGTAATAGRCRAAAYGNLGSEPPCGRIVFADPANIGCFQEGVFDSCSGSFLL